MNTMTMKHIDYGEGMDEVIIPLCDALNSMKGIRTVESCEGHGKNVTGVFFHPTDWTSLAKIQHAIDLRYGGLERSWILECVSTDTPEFDDVPPMTFWLHSYRTYDTSERAALMRDLKRIVLNIQLYHTPWFEEYFANPNKATGSMPEEDYGEYRKELDAIEKGDAEKRFYV